MKLSEDTARRLPYEPPLATAHLPALGGRIGSAQEDFRVEEIPAYLPCGNGEHRYVRVEKRGLSTPELVALIARATRLGERDIGHAGMKDKHAVTVQWLSMPRRSPDAATWKLPSSVRVLEESYHTNKLRTGHLHGNRFEIRIVDLVKEAEERLEPLLDVLRKGLLNAFGEQRFGRGGGNIEQALEWLRDPSSLRGRQARFLSKLYPSVLQAELFNRYLSARYALDLDQLLLGEVVRLDGAGSNFVVEDLATEQGRYELGQLHPQGPMFGPKMRPAAAQALELEGNTLSQLELDAAASETLGRHAPGTRRDLRVPLADLTVRVEDTLEGAPSLRIAFALPAGSFATQVIRELCHGPWLSSRGAAAAPNSDEPAEGSEDE
jgi:tRNA pseudouridine13 synthase